MRKILSLLLISLILATGCRNDFKLNEKEKLVLDSILAHWQTWIPARDIAGTAPMISMEEIYQGLNEEQKSFLDKVRKISPKRDFGFHGPFLGNDTTGVEFQKIEGQVYTLKTGEQKTIPTQFLPKNVYEAYLKMMDAMERDLGKRLLVESGFRAAGYQLRTFLFYTPKHHYDLKETGEWVALPGYSEHGAPQQQAIDFINQEGINGEDIPEEFENLPEYAWLQKNAAQFGFELSYPRGQEWITFEPWHWRYKGK